MSIFWDFSNYDKIELLPCPIITTGTQDMGNGVYKLAAGTPLKKSTQAVSNDGNADCVVAEDYFFISTKADQNKLVPVITKGYVDKALAEAAWGGEFTDAAVSALKTAGIFLVDGALEAGGGGDPGYDVETETVSVIPEQTVTAEPSEYPPFLPYAFLTVDAGLDAFPDSLTVVLDGVEHETTWIDDSGHREYTADDESFRVVILINPNTQSLDAVIEGASLSGSITVEASTTEEVVTVSDEFKAAVAAAGGSVVGNFIINVSYDDDNSYYVMDKTWEEIAAAEGVPVAVYDAGIDSSVSKYFYPVTHVGSGELGYSVEVLEGGAVSEFLTANRDGYPTYSGEQ